MTVRAEQSKGAAPFNSREVFFRLLVLWGLALVVPPAAGWLISGKSILEKTLTSMAQPWSLVLLILGSVGVALFTNDRKRSGSALVGLTLFLWFISAPVVGGKIMWLWEHQVPPYEFGGEPSSRFDYVVVLGGGTGVTPHGQKQLTGSGDRVMLAARMYLRGEAKNLVTTGDILKIDRAIFGGDQSDPSEDTIAIWTDLRIPREVIFELSGQNTSEEIQSLKEHPEFWKDVRCGLLTSAAHMPRAMKLASSRQVNVVPIPADYRAGRGPITVLSFLPEATELSKLHFVAREWFAMQIGR